MNKNIFIKAIFIGIVASIVFILIQPFFGLSTLTSRHAAAYVNLGGYNETVALILSWFVHVSVSTAYAILSAFIFSINSTIAVSTIQVFVLGWVTTLIATPANEWVVKLVTTQTFPDISSLASINTELGAKFWLHVMFFVLVIIGLYVVSTKRDVK
ncbi:hypothetical protein [uncultured Psychromonas sp.]|uniref:hypothetical protein n=1 Tax=uncultured Psychromonas sp. TaxID=173974 RepID=UPI00262076DF|nr:hypothetical protein [uncultured Psychromonas sp.]